MLLCHFEVDAGASIPGQRETKRALHQDVVSESLNKDIMNRLGQSQSIATEQEQHIIKYKRTARFHFHYKSTKMAAVNQDEHVIALNYTIINSINSLDNISKPDKKNSDSCAYSFDFPLFLYFFI